MSATQTKSMSALRGSQIVLNELVRNTMLERQEWLRRLMDPRRDVGRECGHPEVITMSDYLQMYQRGDVSARVVHVWPEESWSERPQVYETEDPEETRFEKAWKDLDLQLSLVPVLYRADILSGIGRFGIILLGLDDGKDLKEPVSLLGTNGKFTPSGTPTSQLLYLRAFDESCVNVSALETDKSNPRYGMPKSYQILFQDTTLPMDTRQGATTISGTEVHWSRVLHLADNRISSDIYGEPRMKKVFNRLLDLNKTAGGSGEMFWKGGFPGISLEAMPEVLANSNVVLDKEATRTQLESYQNGLQRYLALVGMTAKSLEVQVADPGPHLDAQLKLIATALAIPWRVFVGSEAAQLASEQDIRTWNRRITRRREDYLSPFVLLPFVRRLIDVSVLPQPKQGPFVAWPDLNTPSDKDKAVVAEGLTNAITNYVATGASEFITPFHYLTLVLGLSDEEAQSIVQEIGSSLKRLGQLEETTEDPDLSLESDPNEDLSRNERQ